MGKYWRFRGHQNCDKAMFPGVGAYEVPAIPAVHTDCNEFIPFSQAAIYKGNPAEVGIHFLQFDDLFERVWTNPADYISLFRKFKCVTAPDFSMYTDYPRALQIWNHYRNHWLAAYWTSIGLTVVPCPMWSDESSFSWCFSGEPVGSDVIISSMGTQSTERGRYLFSLGYHEMIRRLKPRRIFFQGSVPKDCEGDITIVQKNAEAARNTVRRKT